MIKGTTDTSTSHEDNTDERIKQNNSIFWGNISSICSWWGGFSCLILLRYALYLEDYFLQYKVLLYYNTMSAFTIMCK